MAVIRTEHLSHVYSEGTPFVKMAIQDVNLSIEEGEMVGVIGHTGSGKSTLIQHLNGLLKPTSGKIYIDGEDMWADKAKLREIRFKVGLVFQYPEYQLFEETVYRDIAFGPKNMGLSEEEVDKRVRQAAAFVNVTEEMMNKSPFELSGGQKRRVAIAGVLAMNPKVLILDEPTAGLDPKGRDRFRTDSGVSAGSEKYRSDCFPQHGGRSQICKKGSGHEPVQSVLCMMNTEKVFDTLPRSSRWSGSSSR